MTELPHFDVLVEPIWSNDTPISFDEFVDAATSEVELAFDDLVAPDDDVAPFLVTAEGTEAFLATWQFNGPEDELLKMEDELVNLLVPATLASRSANMAALAITTYLTAQDGGADRREAIIVNCLAIDEGGSSQAVTMGAFITRSAGGPPELGEFEQLAPTLAPAFARPLYAGLTGELSGPSGEGPQEPVDSADEQTDDLSNIADACVALLQDVLQDDVDLARSLPMCLLLMAESELRSFVIDGGDTTENVVQTMRHFAEVLPEVAALATEAHGLQPGDGQNRPPRAWLLHLLHATGNEQVYLVELEAGKPEPEIDAWYAIDYQPTGDFNDVLLRSGMRHAAEARATGRPLNIGSWLRDITPS